MSVDAELDFGPFLRLAPALRVELREASAPVSFKPGEALVVEGDPPGEAFAIWSGKARVLSGDGRLRIAALSAPSLVGEIAALTGEPRNATVRAVTQVNALRIPAAALRRAVDADAEFATELRDFAALRTSVNFMRRSSPFSDLPSETLDELVARLRPLHVPAKGTLVRQDEIGDDVYLIRSGELDVIRETDGSERQIASVGPGAFVGELGALTGAPRSATVRARTPVEAFVLSGDDIRPVVHRYRALLDHLESAMQSHHAPAKLGRAAADPAPDDPDAVILRDVSTGAYLRLTREALAIYEDLDGERTLRELALRHYERTGALDPHGVFGAVAALQSAGLATRPRVAGDAPNARLLRIADLILAPRLEMRDADRLASALRRAVGPVFTRPGAAAAAALGIVGTVALVTTLGQASFADFGVAGLAVAFIGLLVAGLGHEAAHAVATKVEGRRVGRAGIGVLWFSPVIWVDTSDAWLIDRKRRVAINAAGPLFNFAFAGLLGLVAAATKGLTQDLAIWLAVANLVSVAFNASPLLEFDGYYILSDLTNVNALRRKALRYVFHELIAHRAWPTTRLQAGFLAYTAAVIVYVLAIEALTLSGVPHLVEGILADRVAAEPRMVIGVAIALGLAVSVVLPLVTDVRAASLEEG